MPGTPTTRGGFPKVDPSDDVNDFPAVFNATADKLGNEVGYDYQGTLADRASVPQQRGVSYWATDDTTFSANGSPYRHDGTGWRAMYVSTAGFATADDPIIMALALG